MKKMCFIRGPMLGLFCACLSATYGQGSPPTPVATDSDGSGLSVGVKLGVNLNQFRQPGTSIGLNAGGYASYGVLPFLTVRMEPQYSQEGGPRPTYSRSYSDISANVSSVTFINPNVTFHNFQIPLLLELTLPEFNSENVIPKLILGGSYALTMKANEIHTKRYNFVDNLTSDPANSSSTNLQMDVAYQREDVTSNYIRNQWSLIAGFGLQFKAAERDFSFDVRYRYGLNNLNQFRFTSPTFIPGTGSKLYSSGLSFNLSVSLFKF